jgi:peptidyl-prolyl cis-trans isomerase SurA
MGQAQVAHIYVTYPKTTDPADSLKAKQKIDSAYTKLVEGEKFEEVVKLFSEDKGSVSIGGKLPWFGANRMVPEFIVMTRTLQQPGDYSKPFQTVFGWHIITLLERKPVGTFEEEKLGLQNRLNKDRRISLSEESVLNRIKKEYGFKEYPEAKDKLFTTLDTSLLKGQWNAEKAKDLNKVLVSIGDKKYTQYDFAKILAERQNNRITDIASYFNDTYTKFVSEICIAYEDSMLPAKYPEFKRLVQEYHDGILLFDLTDKKVWSKAVKDTTGLQMFYDTHKDKYMWSDRVEGVVYIISNNSSVKAESVQAKVKQKLSVDEVLSTFNVDSVTNVTAERGIFSKGDNEIIDQVEWRKGISNIIPTKRGLSFVDILEVLKPMPKSLDEARGLITADYQAYLEEEWIKELKAKYPVTINENILVQIK